MKNPVCRAVTSLLILLAATAPIACRQETPVQRVERLRSQHSIRLNGWVVRNQPMSSSEDAVSMEEQFASEAEAASAEEEGGEEVAELAEEAAPAEVILDIVVARAGDESLPGITLDLYRAGADGQEKEHRRIWLEVDGLATGVPSQLTHILDDLTIDEGDALSLVLREAIPSSEYADYAEFAGL